MEGRRRWSKRTGRVRDTSGGGENSRKIKKRYYILSVFHSHLPDVCFSNCKVEIIVDFTECGGKGSFNKRIVLGLNFTRGIK